MIPEDVPLLYPPDYYTHTMPRLLLAERGGVRGWLRRVIIRADSGTSDSRLSYLLGKLLASNRTLRERAHFGLPEEMIAGGREHGRALEVGCGGGALLRLLSAAGWQTEGVEVDPEAAAAATRTGIGVVHVGDIFHLNLPLGHYALIVLFHSFEHFLEPVEVLGRVRELLMPSGRAVLVYPNPEGVGARVFGRHWFAWEVPRHMHLLPLRALREAAWRSGLVCSRIRTRSVGSELVYAFSRAYRAARPVLGATVQRSDVWLRRLASTAELAGFASGEEIVATLRHA